MFKFLMGLLCGVAVGTVIAPASGEETRQQLKEKAERWRDDQVEKGRDTARDVGSAVAERLYDRAVGEE